VRFVAATNRDLREEIQRGSFRSDLYYRLSGVTLAIPPLRERADELEPLARTFLAQAASRRPGAATTFSPAAVAALRAHDWPGNIRELRNVVERAVLFARDGVVDVADLQLPAPWTGAPRSDAPPAEPGGEEGRIRRALDQCAGNQTAAAQLLGISRRTLVNRIEAYGIARPRKG
jgi:DNA-binding NtrC family response regulator